METWLQAALLGIIEGFTEFIPVSSTGHLILLIDLLGFKGPEGKVFEIVIQLGAILAICWLYRAKLFGALWAAPHDPVQRRFLTSIVIAFFPAAVLGVMFHSAIKNVLFNPLVVAVTLIIGGIIIIVIERVIKPEPRIESVDAIDWKMAVKIGLCQALAMIPGTSRSGATIMGSLMLGLSREAATQFSFFLAIPTMLGATVYDVYKNRDVLSLDGIEIIAIGFIAAFITAMLVVRWVVAFVSHHGFVSFAIYRIALGSVMLLILL